MMAGEKSYFYVLYEGDATELEDRVIKTFEKFSRVHGSIDSAVEFLTPKDIRFRMARENYEIRKLPAFALTDEPGFSNEDPYIKVERDILEKFSNPDDMYAFLTDLHYVVLDDRVLRKKVGLAWERLEGVLKAIWQEVKDLIRIQVVPGS